MAVWEQAMVGLAIFAVLYFWGPGAKNALEDSQQAENPDWKGALIPIAMVVLFVIVLISLVRS
ncbi:MAG TPA: hypothetical protein EYQ42_10285 [Thiotrichaceae bacterium]|jgi:hypothetical protein|nr:hypothetical protein [Thiotrichaceae bacterium]HIM08352.1 hypothetical protein [Gammaproteobacteria bacterium]